MRNTRGTIVGLDVHKDTIAAACIDEATAKLRDPVSYTHLRAHETVLDLVCRLLLEKKNKHIQNPVITHTTTI